MLRESFELNFFAHQKVAQAAVKIMLAQGTGGCLLFNVSKQAVNPGADFGPYGLPKAATLFLVRQYALDYGADGIRANAVNADRIRSGILTDDFIKERAKARGVSEQNYMTGNLLHREVTADDVAQAFLAQALALKTTADVTTVDGGNIAAALALTLAAELMLWCHRGNDSQGATTMLRTLGLFALPLRAAGEPGIRDHHQGEDGDLQGRRRIPETRRRQSHSLHQEVHGQGQLRAGRAQATPRRRPPP